MLFDVESIVWPRICLIVLFCEFTRKVIISSLSDERRGCHSSIVERISLEIAGLFIFDVFI